MKIERISENKIKITVSIEDLVERNINVDTLNYNSREAQELFWDMMKEAEVEFGFSTSDAQLCIETFPDMIEGFIITITKVEEEDASFESIQKYIRNKYKKSELRAKKKPRKVHSPLIVFVFHDMDSLKSASSRIRNDYIGKSTLFKHANTYYLVLQKNAWISSSSIETLLLEYGKRINLSVFYEGYLEEYAKKIAADNAIEIIEQYY